MIYISLCAMPDRLEMKDSSSQCLSSLLEQETAHEYKVLLNIPLKLKNYENTTIPQWVLDLEVAYNGKLIILRDEIDYGPISNLLSPIKLINMDLNDIIIVCDDDHMYDPKMIEYHLKKLQQYPDHHAICFRGNQPLELRTWYVNNVKYGKLYNSCVLFPTRNDIYLKLPDHWHSVSYRRKFIQQDIFDQDFLNISWNNDILMGCYAWSHDFYFLCANYDQESDFRPVNYDGRGANSFPLMKMLPFSGDSGCNRWRNKNKKPGEDIWDLAKFQQLFDKDKGIIQLWK